MRRRSRTRRVLKWVGAAVCVLTLGIWALSTRYAFTNAPPYAPKTTAVLVDSGNLHVMWISPPQALALGTMDAFVTTSANQLTLDRPWPAWGRMRSPAGGVLGASTLSRVTIPIWLVFLPAFVLTAFLWWRDRRRFPPGHCQNCGYNLTGNVSGRCPECGTPIEAGHTGSRGE
jgi:hypothetical protein